MLRTTALKDGGFTLGISTREGVQTGGIKREKTMFCLSYHNKMSLAGMLTTKILFLTVLEPGSPRSRL